MSEPADPSRRQFFRRFAGEVISGASQVAGAVAEMRERSASEASALLGEPSAAERSPQVGSDGHVRPAAGAPPGYRTPFRFDSDDVLLVIDQRRLPDALLEIPVRGAPDAAHAIRELIVGGAPAIGQVAAFGLALTARVTRAAQPHARQVILHGAANTLRNARPGALSPRLAVDRLLARYAALGELSRDGEAIAGALMDEAMAIVAEAAEVHARLAEAGLAALPDTGDRPLRLLTHGSTGPLASGQLGTALAVVQLAHQAERPVHAWVAESRPGLAGARITAWELAGAGVPYTIVADGATASLMARGEVDAVLAGAERIAANGDVAGEVGTLALAALAERHGVPFLVCATLSAVDLSTASGGDVPIDERPASELTTIRGVRLAPAGAAAFNPLSDVTPAALIGALVTDEGVLRPPYDAALRDALERRGARRAAAAPVEAGG